MTRVSVIVPIYNAEKRLETCINSILRQTFKDFELILVNDGSTDNSLAICEKHRRKDGRIRIIDKQNEGCILARRIGLNASGCEYAMFVDADDWIAPSAIEILYNETTSGSLDIAVGNTYRVLGFIKQKNTSEYFQQDTIYDREAIRKKLVMAYFQGDPFPSHLPGKLYKKDLLASNGKYLDRIKFLGEDLFYNMEIFLKANRVKVIREPLYYYRIDGATSRYMPYFFHDIFNGYEIQKEVIREHYQDLLQHQYNGISVMLLNLFRGGLYNLFNSKLIESEIKELIRKYADHENVREALQNDSTAKQFPKEYLDALQNRDAEFLFSMGESMYKSKKPKRLVMNMIAKMSLN